MGRRRRRRRKGGAGLAYELAMTSISTLDEILSEVIIPAVGLPQVALAWGAGDANIPPIWDGAENTTTRLAAAGTIAARSAPWQDADGADIPCEYHQAGSRATLSAAVLDPTAGQDTYTAMLYRFPEREVGGAQAFFGNTIGVSRGQVIYCDAAGVTTFLAVGDALKSTAVTGVLGAWIVIQTIYDADGNLLLALGSTENTTSAPAGAIFPSTAALTIDGPTFAIQGSEVAWVIHCTGTGIADKITAAVRAELLAKCCGTCPGSGTAPTFGRASAASVVDHNGRHSFVFNHRPRAGDSIGFRDAPGRINKVYRNCNPADTSACAVSGGTLTVKDDAAQLLADGVDVWGPRVYQFVPGASDRIVISGGASANTNAHSLQVLIRGAAGGETVTLSLRDASDGSRVACAVITCTTAWQHIRAHAVIPTDTDMQWCLACEAGDTILFIGGQCEEGARCTSLIPCFAYAAGATRAAETLDLGWTPSDVAGAVEATITPLGMGRHRGRRLADSGPCHGHGRAPAGRLGRRPLL